MFNKILIIGMGEVGRAHFNVLKKVYPDKLFYKDTGPNIYDSNNNIYYDNQHKGFDLLLISTQCNPDNMAEFHNMVWEYIGAYQPKHVDILTTCPPLTCEAIAERLEGVSVTRSSVRGMHPNLDQFLYDIPKHIGGPNNKALEAFYSKAGVTCILHEKAKSVEIFHPLNNFIYGINILAADECAKYCREFGVDYIEFLSYRKSNNDGFVRAGYPSKVSPILTPLNNNGVLGHCVSYAPTVIPENKRGPLAKMLAEYNKEKNISVKPGH